MSQVPSCHDPLPATGPLLKHHLPIGDQVFKREPVVTFDIQTIMAVHCG